MAQLKDLPFEIEAPGANKPMMEREAPSEAGGEGKIPGYVEPWERCANCEYFDGDSRCKKFNAPADMDGSCPSFEEGDAGGESEEAAEGGAEEGTEGDE